MAIDPAQIELTLEQKQRLAVLAEQEGKDYTEVVDELLSSASIPGQDGASSANLYEALDCLCAIGCFEWPGDLSTNPKHMEGFGINASRRSDSD